MVTVFSPFFRSTVSFRKSLSARPAGRTSDSESRRSLASAAAMASPVALDAQASAPLASYAKTPSRMGW